MLERLPTELQELICGLLDGESLLSASCVCWQWNRIIMELQHVWKLTCLRNGFGHFAPNWKEQYIACRHLLQDLKHGRAFQHRNFAPKCFHSCDVRDIAYSNGLLLAGIHKNIRIWRMSDLKPVAMFDVPYEVFRLGLSQDGTVLVVGHYDGIITSWLLVSTHDEVTSTLLQEYIGHTDNVVCVSVSVDSDLLCSGSRDRTIKLWSLASGELLKDLPASGWVVQVSLIYSDIFSLLITDQSCVRLYTWHTHPQHLHGDLNDMKDRQLDFLVDKKVSMRKIVTQGKNIAFVRNCSVVIMSLDTLTELKCFSLDCRDLVVLASGARFMLVTLWGSCQKNTRLGIIDMSTGEVVGTYPMPFCREYVVTGNMDWLDELPQHRAEQLVVAGWMMGVMHMNELTDMLYLVKWR